MSNENLKPISLKEKWQIINGTVLVFAAILLYFLSFILTLAIGFDVISAGSTMLATGLAFFGLSSFIKTQMIDFQAGIEKRVRKLEKTEDVK